MNRTAAVLVTIVTLMATSAFANPNVKRDFSLLKDVSTVVNTYPYYTIFDDVMASVDNGVVTLTGRVTMGYKSQTLTERVSKIDGVRKVRDEIGLLPASQLDDNLRHRIARRIYGNTSFVQYNNVSAPIHIIVDHGRVTLKGIVIDNVDRMKAHSLAVTTGAFTVTNELLTPGEVKAPQERKGKAMPLSLQFL